MAINWNNLPKDDLAWGTLLPKLGSPVTSDECKSLALALGLRGAGRVSPNPQVGCVIVSSEQRFVAAGAHLLHGGPHAEVEAVRSADAAGLSVKGGTAWVTLEPCAHFGKTPPCADLLKSRGIAKVFIGKVDPNPLVGGRGIENLRGAGIAVEVAAEGDPWEQACSELAEVFLHGIARQSPFVGLKVATSIDGVSARRGDTRKWITGERARDYGHFLRMRYDSILVGPGTAVADDPTLNVRPPRLGGRTPLRVLLDPTGSVLQAAQKRRLNLFCSEPGRTIVFVGKDWRVGISESFGDLVRVIPLGLDRDGHFLWADILANVWNLGARSLLLEGGAGIHASALTAGVVSRLHWFRAPHSLAGPDALLFAGGRGPEQFGLENMQTIRLGPDLLYEGNIKPVGLDDKKS